MTFGLKVNKANIYTVELLSTLGEIAPTLRKLAQEEIMAAAAPAVASVRSLVPPLPPMSGWARGRRTKWDSSAIRNGVTARKRRSGSDRDRDIIPLLSVVQTNPAGVIYDVAMQSQPVKSGKPRRQQKQNDKFVENLLVGYGKSSRYMWPGVTLALPAVENALRDAVREMEAVINRSL